jgi:hypothetical protein
MFTEIPTRNRMSEVRLAHVFLLVMPAKSYLLSQLTLGPTPLDKIPRTLTPATRNREIQEGIVEGTSERIQSAEPKIAPASSL